MAKFLIIDFSCVSLHIALVAPISSHLNPIIKPWCVCVCVFFFKLIIYFYFYLPLANSHHQIPMQFWMISLTFFSFFFFFSLLVAIEFSILRFSHVSMNCLHCHLLLPHASWNNYRDTFTILAIIKIIIIIKSKKFKILLANSPKVSKNLILKCWNLWIMAFEGWKLRKWLVFW